MLPQLQERLDALDARALLVVAGTSRDPDLLPFVGAARLTKAVVVVPQGKAPHLVYFTPMERDEAAKAKAVGCRVLSPERLDLARWIRECSTMEDLLATVLGQAFLHAGVAPGRVALAGRGAAGHVHHACTALGGDGWSFFSGHEALAGARRFKDEVALTEMRRVAEATGAAFYHVARVLRQAAVDPTGGLVRGAAPLTVGCLKGEIAAVFATADLEQPEGNIVAPAEEGAVPHNQGTLERPLRVGESIVVDLFPRGRLFADCTRTFCVGVVPPPLRAAHRATLGALRLASDKARAGARGWDLNQDVCAFLEAAGYPTHRSHPESLTGFVHGLGHGVGFDLHDAPGFREGDQGEAGELLAGDVVTLEPGLYDSDAGWGVRLEDLVLVTEAGIENWTPLPYALDPHEWPATA
jgi:Xaa-Pro aminopeptidase